MGDDRQPDPRAVVAGVGGAPETFEGVGELVLGEPWPAIEDVHADDPGRGSVDDDLDGAARRRRGDGVVEVVVEDLVERAGDRRGDDATTVDDVDADALLLGER